MSVVLFAVLTAVLGPGVLPYLLVQLVLGFPLLEVANYLEHYGLLRQRRPTRRFQALRHFDEAPQLPTGYAGMIVLALVPPLWRRSWTPG